jgi:hypothetical protein
MDPQQQDRQSPAPHMLSPPPRQEPRVTSPEQTKKELQQAIQGSNQILTTATTVITLFPDTLTLDRAKLTVTKRRFFKTAEVMSIRIEDVLNVTADVDVFFGSIKISNRVMNTDKPYSIGNFRRRDAIHFKRVAQGYIIALQRDIDCSTLPTSELVGMLDKLGEDNHDPRAV